MRIEIEYTRRTGGPEVAAVVVAVGDTRRRHVAGSEVYERVAPIAAELASAALPDGGNIDLGDGAETFTYVRGGKS